MVVRRILTIKTNRVVVCLRRERKHERSNDTERAGGGWIKTGVLLKKMTRNTLVFVKTLKYTRVKAAPESVLEILNYKYARYRC